MLESVDVIKQILKYVTPTKCQRHFRVFCPRNNFHMRTARKKPKLCNVLMLCGSLLTKPICKNQLVSLYHFKLSVVISIYSRNILKNDRCYCCGTYLFLAILATDYSSYFVG